MATTDTAEHTGEHTATGHHPTPRQYANIGILLAVLTALEVSLFYLDVGPLFVPALVLLMVAKFSLVVGYYMHLKFDARIFRRLMLAGLILAAVLYAVVLVTFAGVIRLGT